MRAGLTEWAIVTSVLVAIATAGALRFGGEIRAAFGAERSGGLLAPPAVTVFPTGTRTPR